LFVALGVLASRYGYDSRDGLCRADATRWWTPRETHADGPSLGHRQQATNDRA
jgi:hypothetical protein